LEYEAEEDEISDMIVNYRHIFEKELELIEEESESEDEEDESEEEEEESEDEEEEESEDEAEEVKENETVVNADDKNSFLVDALFKIKNK